MQCPNCDTEDRLKTTETFQTKDATYRTKKCPACHWNFTTKEEVTDDLIPNYIRRSKRKGFLNEQKN